MFDLLRRVPEKVILRFYFLLKKDDRLMEDKKTSVFSNGLIWFGAAISIAEILTGTLIAPIGLKKGIIAIIIGHLVGCILLYFAGLIGGITGKSSMETVKNSFGQRGSLFFSIINILQLIGWTAVMILSGANAANSTLNVGGKLMWIIIIGFLIIIWILVGVKNLSKLNTIAMAALFITTIALSTVIFKDVRKPVYVGNISFSGAMELAIAMPLSWLPLISDYTRIAEKPKKATAVSVIVYFFTSSWMYIIGLGATVFTGKSDISKIILSVGGGSIALIIIIFSTVTTTFLDAYSAGVSAESVIKGVKGKHIAIGSCILGMILSYFTPIEQYENFLYFISSVFAPMISILIVDFFIIKKEYHNDKYNMSNLIIWVIGFVIYRFFISVDTPIGSTIPAMTITAILCCFKNIMFGGNRDV
ncbi:hypothetical protein CLROS_035400 [Clostridium felsineum]|uniref:Uncharacterized protein n=2 Tax=Clostridium felsineum TaxID=36839 RepID=A0A1S8KXV4_9CLOT|nr:hypothetical protein CLROS_035400 [Clostridium felsineum]URZ13205.1 hypothetical protein CROST_039550 [Clostridium felsineum]